MFDHHLQDEFLEWYHKDLTLFESPGIVELLEEVLAVVISGLHLHPLFGSSKNVITTRFR